MATENNKQVLNAPNLRFPEFSGEWERFRVSDILEFYPTNSLSWDQLDYETKEIYNLHYGLIHVGLPTLVDLTKSILPSIKEGVTIQNYELCKEGDIAFADASEDTNEVAKVVEFKNTDNKKVVCGLHCIHGRDIKNKTITGFKGYAFSSAAFHNQIRNIAQGTKIYSINRSNFSECYVSIPTKGEQKKITVLLSLLDNRIATQSEAIKDLNLLKGAVIDRLILQKPRNAEMGQVCSIGEQTKVVADPERILTVRLKGKGICWSQAENLELGATQYYKRKAGQLIYGKQNFHNGAIDIVPQCFDGGITSKDIPSFDINSKICNPQYLLAQISSPKFYKPVEALTTGTGSKRLHENNFLKIPIVLPPLEEQNKIVALIESLNRKLKNKGKYYNQLCKQKNYLLQQMFI